jgi:hypothetical protein
MKEDPVVTKPKPNAAQRAYRWSVLPLGIFMIIGGIVMPIVAMFAPANALLVPPFSDPGIKRFFFAGMTLPLLPLGIGFCLRKRLAFWLFFVWIFIGTAWHFVAGIVDPVYRLPSVEPLLAFGIYLCTRAAFSNREGGR